jgi:apolipoprotein N-acyltransferase
LPVLAGVLLAASYPPARLVLPAFVGLVPLLVFIAEQPRSAEGRWSATRAGLLTGVVYFGLQLYWLAMALGPYSGFAIPAYALTVLVLGGLTGAFGWGLHYTTDRLRLPLVLTAALLWTTMEWIQGRLGDFAFPWLGLGYALVPYPTLAGAADLVGARGLTLWIAAVNGLLAMAVVSVRVRARATARPLAAALLLTMVPAGYGTWRAVTLEMRPVARVAVVQPNIPQRIRLDLELALDTSIVVLNRLSLETMRTELEGAEAIDLVAWPEVALTADLAGHPGLSSTVQDLSARIATPILVGAYGVGAHDPDARADRPRPLYNSAFLVDAAGLSGARYDKRRLVPFVERVPLRPTARRFGGLERGGDPSLFVLPDAPPRAGHATFGVLICYEAIFSHLAREHRLAGADFLVNITNDAWFGRDTWYGRTTALWQHPAHVTMRAIENRMGIARAANTGISLFVDPLGRTRQATPLFVEDVRIDTILTTDPLTLYSRWGDWLATLASIMSLGLLLTARLRSRAAHRARPAFTPRRFGPTASDRMKPHP